MIYQYQVLYTRTTFHNFTIDRLSLGPVLYCRPNMLIRQYAISTGETPAHDTCKRRQLLVTGDTGSGYFAIIMQSSTDECPPRTTLFNRWLVCDGAAGLNTTIYHNNTCIKLVYYDLHCGIPVVGGIYTVYFKLPNLPYREVLTVRCLGVSNLYHRCRLLLKCGQLLPISHEKHERVAFPRVHIFRCGRLRAVHELNLGFLSPKKLGCR